MKTVSSYKTTKVHWGKSQANICKLLNQYGIKDIRFTFLSSRNELVCEFNYPTKIEDKEVSMGGKNIITASENRGFGKGTGTGEESNS